MNRSFFLRFGATTLSCLSAAATAQQQSAKPVGELFAADDGTKLVQPAGAGMSVVAGSELSAGVAPARLRLYRGGQVRICPRSTVSVNSGKFGLMFAMGTGTLEVDYSVAQRGADFVITPDLSLQLSGPGSYHFALGVNKKGDTCVKALPDNHGVILITELLGSTVYKTNIAESTMFRSGKLDSNTALTEECGCPIAQPSLQAAAPKPVNPAAQSQDQPGERVMLANSSPDATAPLPADRPGQVHVEVDTPFVFRASADGVKPYSVAKLNLASLPNVYFLQEKVDPVVLPLEKPAQVSVKPEEPTLARVEQPQKKEKKGFFGRVGGFFSGLFRR
jgi:hypothetical protein